MTSNRVLVISENRQAGSEVLLCLDSAGFEGRQCSFSQATYDIEQSTPALALFDAELVHQGTEDGLDNTLFNLLIEKNITLLIMAPMNYDTIILQQKSRAKEVVRINNLGPELLKWLANNKAALFAGSPARPSLDELPEPDLSLPNRIAPPPRPGSSMAQSIAPPPRPGSSMAQSIAPPPRPGAPAPQSIAPPPRPGAPAPQSIAPPPRPGAPAPQSIAPPPRPRSSMVQAAAVPDDPVAPHGSIKPQITQSSDTNIIADTFSPVRKPVIRKMNKPVTVSANALESIKKPPPPIVSSKLLKVSEDSKELPPTINIATADETTNSQVQASQYRHILFIDKNPLIQHTLRKLAYSGLPCEWASNITDGAILLKDEQPASVFIHECLDELSGTQACSYIKNIETYKDLPILIITEEGTSLTEEDINTCGASGSIQEPFTSECLIRFLSDNQLIISLTGENLSQNVDSNPVSLTISTHKPERSGVRKKPGTRRKPAKDDLLDVPEQEIAVPNLLDEALEFPDLDDANFDISSPVDDLPDIDFPDLDP